MPVSLQWQRSLLRRLDGIVPFYRVVSEVSKAQGCEAKWRWFSSGALDGMMTTGGGRTLGLIRFGPTMSWKAMRSRLGTVYNGQRRAQAAECSACGDWKASSPANRGGAEVQGDKTAHGG